MMMTSVAPPTTLPISTPTIQNAKSSIAGAKEAATQPAEPSPLEVKEDTYTKTQEKVASATPEASSVGPRNTANDTPKKHINWPLVGGITVAVTGAVALIAFLAKGGEKAVENMGKQAEHSHTPKTGKSTCTTEGCDHSSHSH